MYAIRAAVADLERTSTCGIALKRAHADTHTFVYAHTNSYTPVQIPTESIVVAAVVRIFAGERERVQLLHSRANTILLANKTTHHYAKETTWA